MYNYKIKLDRVIDGDTIDAYIDLGFDVSIVIFTAVIEHLYSANLVLSEIYRILKPKGIVIIRYNDDKI